MFEARSTRKKVTSIHMDVEIYNYIQNIAEAEGRTFSAMAERLLRGVMQQAKEAANG